MDRNIQRLQSRLFPLGVSLRPHHHACSTGAQHDAYNVVCGESMAIEARWPRFSGC